MNRREHLGEICIGRIMARLKLQVRESVSFKPESASPRIRSARPEPKCCKEYYRTPLRI
jgi:hypothetical protein